MLRLDTFGGALAAFVLGIFGIYAVAFAINFIEFLFAALWWSFG